MSLNDSSGDGCLVMIWLVVLYLIGRLILLEVDNRFLRIEATLRHLQRAECLADSIAVPPFRPCEP